MFIKSKFNYFIFIVFIAANIRTALAADNNLNVQDKFGNTPAHRAVKLKNIKKLDYLIEHKADLNIKNSKNLTPLELAIIKKRPTAVAHLAQAQKDELNSYDEQSLSPLIYAIATHNISAVDTLLANGADINLPNKKGNTPLIVAVQEHVDITEPQKNEKIIEHLIKKGANINQQNNEGDTPLHIALGDISPFLAKILISNKADLTIKNNKGSTPLHILAYYWNIPSTQVARFSEKFRKNKKDKKNPRISSAAMQNEQIVRANIAKSIIDNLNKNQINILNNQGQTPLDVAVSSAKQLYNPGLIHPTASDINNKLIELLKNSGAKLSKELKTN